MEAGAERLFVPNQNPPSSAFVPQVSEKETVSQSAGSPATDVAVSSSRNGPLTSGTSKSARAASSPRPLFTCPRRISVCLCSCCDATVCSFFIFDLQQTPATPPPPCPVLNQSSQTRRPPARSRPRRCSPASRSSGPPNVLRTANSPASPPTAPWLGMEQQPPETAPTRSGVNRGGGGVLSLSDDQLLCLISRL